MIHPIIENIFEHNVNYYFEIKDLIKNFVHLASSNNRTVPSSSSSQQQRQNGDKKRKQLKM